MEGNERRGPAQDDADPLGKSPGAAASRSVAFSTLALPARQQADAWRACNAPSLDVLFHDDSRAARGFMAEREVRPLGGLVMNRVVATGATAVRSAGHLRRDGLDHWCFNLTTRGARRFRWDRDDSCVIVPAGQLHIQSLDETYRGTREDSEWVGIFVPRERIPSLSEQLEATRGQPRDDARSRMLCDFILHLWRALPGMTETEAALAADAACAVIESCVRPVAGAADPHVQQHQRMRALSFIRRNLRSSRLSPQLVARVLDMSRSQLYRAFEPVGGVARAIQAERLKAAGRLLLQAGDPRSIAEIAEAVGIFDPSSFSRMFRRHFGMTAGDWRASMGGAAGAPGERHFPGFALADFLDAGGGAAPR